MSSAVKVWLPISTRLADADVLEELHVDCGRWSRCPRASSLAALALASLASAARPNIGLTIRVISTPLGRVEELEAELDEAQVGPAARGAGLEHGRAQR